METTNFIDILSQLPVVATVLITCYFLLREISRRDKIWRQLIKEQGEINREFLTAVIQETRQALADTAELNSQALTVNMEKVEVVLTRLETVIDKLVTQTAINTAAIIMHDASVKGEGDNGGFSLSTEQIVEKLLSGLY